MSVTFSKFVRAETPPATLVLPFSPATAAFAWAGAARFGPCTRFLRRAALARFAAAVIATDQVVVVFVARDQAALLACPALITARAEGHRARFSPDLAGRKDN